MQFFDVDGNEIDIQEPRFFIDETLLLSMQEAITEILNIYVDV